MNYKYNGRPIISNAEFDLIGEKLIKRDQPDAIEKHQAVDIEALIENAGMLLDFQPLEPHVFGVTAFKDMMYEVREEENKKVSKSIPLDKGTVLINSILYELDNGESRLRFTEAHEYCHQKLHPKFFQYRESLQNNLPMVCFRTAVNDGYLKDARTEVDWLEWQANKLAAALLMPLCEVKLAFQSELEDRHIGKSVLPWEDKPLPLYQHIPAIIHSMASHFDVSKVAMRYRLEKLSLI